MFFWSTFLFFEKTNKKCFFRLYLELKPFRVQEGFLSFQKMLSFLVFFFCISLASFLNTSFVYPFFHPFLFLSLLVSLSWLVSSSWIFHSSFFHLLFFFSPFFPLFSLFCFSLFFWISSMNSTCDTSTIFWISWMVGTVSAQLGWSQWASESSWCSASVSVMPEKRSTLSVAQLECSPLCRIAGTESEVFSLFTV